MSNQLIFSSKVVFVGGNAITLPVAASDPGTAVNGDLYYNSTTNHIKSYVNGAWHTIQEDGISALTGDVTASGPGSAAATIAAGAVTASKLGTITDGVTLDQSGAGATLEVKALGIANAQIANSTIDLTTKVTGILPNSNTTATNANTASTIVARDSSGNFTAGTITAALTGAASANVLKAGDTMSGTLDMGANKITTTYVPLNAADLTNKAYVDAHAGTASSALDGTFVIQNTASPTKQMNFSAAGITAGQTRTITMPDANVDLGNLTNSNISASAAIVYSKLSLTNSIVNNDINGSAAIAYGKLALSGSIVDSDISASAAIALNKLAALTANKVLLSDASGFISASSVSNTTLGYLDATSSIQTQIDSKLATSAFTDAAVTGKLITGFTSGAATVLATDTILQAINKLDGNIGLRALDADVIKKNGSVAFTADQSMGGFKLTNLANGTTSNDAINYSQLQAVANGNIWLAPILDPDLVDDSLSAPPGSPVSNTVYLIGASPSGLWAGLAGHVVYYSGSSWIDILSRAVQVGDRFGIIMEHGAIGNLGGNMVGNSYKIAQVTNATPGSYAYSYHTPALYDTVLDNNSASQHFSHSYNYNGSAWVEIAGPGVITPGNALSFSGNTLNVLYDNVTLDLTTNQLEVKAGGISDSHINASAAIAYSKLAALTTGKALQSNASTGFIEVSSVTNTELGYLSGVTSAIQTQLGNKASTTLNNLGTTAINANLIAAADLTSDLGTSAARWNNLFVGTVDSGASALTLKSSASNGSIVLNPNGTGTIDLKVAKLRQTDSSTGTNWMETQYFDALSLSANISSATEISSSLSFALASFNGAIINYTIKEATSNSTRVGQLYVCTDGTVASSSDQYSETASLGSASILSLDATITGGNVVIRYNNTHATNAATMRCQIRRLRA